LEDISLGGNESDSESGSENESATLEPVGSVDRDSGSDRPEDTTPDTTAPSVGPPAAAVGRN
jgi:hypothetical protein